MMKKRIAALLAFAMAVSFLPTVTMADSASTPEVTVVGKRITDGDPYFEISLEVNGKYEDYSAVNVVLEYDPAIIVPAASWDEGAGPADMKENTTWATRRALPTLGKETWSSHIALAYQTETEYDTDGTTVKTPSKGYLYLGAEYPGETANTADSESEGDEETPADDPGEEDSADADTDPHQKPVVVARFMYAAPTKYPSGTAEEIADERANTKEKLEALWQTGEYPAKASATAADHWDNDWSKNKILTIAPDDIAFESPAQFPFAYYNANFEERAYMHTFPTAAPTTDPSASPATTSVPTAVHTVYANGSRIAETDRLKDTDINVVLGQGKSAKTQGGMSLSDVMAILFFDWDDTLIGSLTAAKGMEMSKDVSNYVQNVLVHPDLQENDKYASLDRIDTYRGEYPSNGPDPSDPRSHGGPGTFPDVLDADGNNTNMKAGSLFPVTNKVDYVLGGKTLHDGAPYAGGWTHVIPSAQEFNTSKYPGYKEKLIPRVMSDVWTALRENETFGLMPELDDNGNFVDTSLQAKDIPDVISYDFDNITEDDLTDGVLYVKAVYLPGTFLSEGDSYYTYDDNFSYSMLTSIAASDKAYGISFSYRRLNSQGYGVDRGHKPKIRMGLTQQDEDGKVIMAKPTYLSVDVDNEEVIDVLLTPSQFVNSLTYQLVETNNLNIITASDLSFTNTNVLKLKDNKIDGFKQKAEFSEFQKQVVGLKTGSPSWVLVFNDFATHDFVYTYKKGVVKYFENKSALTAAKKYLQYFVQVAYAAPYNQTDPSTYTWYQIQYAILSAPTSAKKVVYKTPDEAKAWCEDPANFPADALPK